MALFDAAAPASEPPSWSPLAAVAVALLALIPVVGYLEFLALPFLAVRLRRRRPERYAGLRTLAD